MCKALFLRSSERIGCGGRYWTNDGAGALTEQTGNANLFAAVSVGSDSVPAFGDWDGPASSRKLRRSAMEGRRKGLEGVGW